MIESAQECQNLIVGMSSEMSETHEFMSDPHAQYEYRNRYIEVLDYAIGSDELYHLYDIWQVFAQAREEATRGFFLDLWDIYNKKESFNGEQRERTILRYFVCQIHNQFDQILSAEKITAPNLWQEYVRELLHKLMWIEDSQASQLERRLLYSMSHLYGYLYPIDSISGKEEAAALLTQLKAANQAISCIGDEDNSSILVTSTFRSAEADEKLQREFALAFLYLYRFANHFSVVSLQDFVSAIISSLSTEALIEEISQSSGEELLEQLIRYWGATSPLMRFFLQEKLGFTFYEAKRSQPPELPAPYGTDHFIYTMGEPNAGKTYFLHAMEHMSRRSDGQLSLTIDYDNEAEEDDFNRARWQRQEQLGNAEKSLVGMRSKVRHLCRFTFYEVKETQESKNYITRWKSLQGYLQRRLPSAIMLLFSTDEAGSIDSYVSLVRSIEDLTREDERYRDIPIYFLFNQSDRLVSNIKESPDFSPQLLSEFQKFISCQVPFSDRCNFFSLRHQEDVGQLNILEIVNRTRTACANLAFNSQLSQDIARVQKTVDSLISSGFTNLNFVYTCALFQNDERYSDLKSLWDDVTDLMIKSTYKDVEKYYSRAFQLNLERDFKKLDRFHNKAEVTSSLEFGKDGEGRTVFDRFKDAFRHQAYPEDLSNLLCILNVNDRHTVCASSVSLSAEPALDDFFKEKTFIENFLRKALRATLEELAIPIETSQGDDSGDRTYRDLRIKELKFIEPEAINNYEDIWQFYGESSAVSKFVDNEYAQMRAEIKRTFLQGILEYNSTKQEEEQLKVDRSDLEIIIEALPSQLQAIDVANRNEAFAAPKREKSLFAYALNNTSTLCSIQCGKFEKADKELIQGAQGSAHQTVLERLLQFKDFEQSRRYCQLLSNYLPRYPQKPKYPQFLLVKAHPKDKDVIQIELDETKIDVIRELDNRLKQQQLLLLDMLEILLENYHSFNSLYEGTSREYCSQLYAAQCLLRALEKRHFDNEQFQSSPEQYIDNILDAANLMADITNPANSGSVSENLERFGEIYQQIKLSSETYLLSLNTREIGEVGEKIAKDLKAAYTAYSKIYEFLKRDEVRLRSLISPESVIKRFDFSKANEYNNILNEYVRQRKLLILLERVEYLRVSRWVEDVQWINNFFDDYASSRTWGNLTSIGTSELNRWKDDFIKSIKQLLSEELFLKKQDSETI